MYVDMDCDGLKKNLLIDTDGSALGKSTNQSASGPQPASVFSQSAAFWGK